MKRLFFLLFILGSLSLTRAQENMVTLSGGYAFANLEDVDSDATGWRINGLYEFVPRGGQISHGISFGYTGVNSEDGSGDEAVNYKINSYPIYYAPKYTFGKKALKLFIKGAFGMHYTNYKRTGLLVESTTFDMGFYGGAGAGLVFEFKEKFFINAEYEWAYLSNAVYRNGMINSVMAGIGMKF